MNLTIAHRDTPIDETYLRDVSTYLVQRDMLIVLFNDGSRRNYPLTNIRWFGEVKETVTGKQFVGYSDPDETIDLDPVSQAVDNALALTDVDLGPTFNHPTPTRYLK